MDWSEFKSEGYCQVKENLSVLWWESTEAETRNQRFSGDGAGSERRQTA